MLALLLQCSLCASAPNAPHVDIRSIGIIAALGDTCMFERVGNAPFEWIGSPQASFLEVSDWGIDDAVIKAITGTLDTHYTIQSIAIEHQDFDTWTDHSLALRVRELPVPETPVDAYLLILRDWRGDEIGNSSHQVAGLGLYRRDLPHGGRRTAVFASYRLVVVEPDRGRIIASRAVSLPDGRLPWLAISPALWPRTQNDLSGAQRETLQADFIKLIDATLPFTLPRLGLQTKIPSPRR